MSDRNFGEVEALIMQITIRLNWLVIPAIALATLLIGKHFTASNMLWYSSLKLPIITPPAWFMSSMWLVIYTLTTGCALLVYNTFARNARFWFIMLLFALNAGLNSYWTYLFFTQHELTNSIWCSFVLSATVWLLAYLIRPESLLCSLLLLPYAIWTTYAIVLTTWIRLIQ